MPKEHDFKRFPELSNSQLETLYFKSPHRQIVEPINVRVVKVIDGDTVRVKWRERNFDFPVRLANLAAAELDEVGGERSQAWLSSRILGKIVEVVPTRSRVEKWGRLLAYINFGGQSISEESVDRGFAITWDEANSGS